MSLKVVEGGDSEPFSDETLSFSSNCCSLTKGLLALLKLPSMTIRELDDHREVDDAFDGDR